MPTPSSRRLHSRKAASHQPRHRRPPVRHRRLHSARGPSPRPRPRPRHGGAPSPPCPLASRPRPPPATALSPTLGEQPSTRRPPSGSRPWPPSLPAPWPPVAGPSPSPLRRCRLQARPARGGGSPPADATDARRRLPPAGAAAATTTGSRLALPARRRGTSLTATAARSRPRARGPALPSGLQRGMRPAGARVATALRLPGRPGARRPPAGQPWSSPIGSPGLQAAVVARPSPAGKPPTASGGARSWVLN